MPALVRLVTQRHEADCTVAALAMLLSVSYEEALLVMNDPRVLAEGAYLTQIVAAADAFGVRLRKLTRWTADTHDGIARVNYRKDRDQPHVVVVRRGLLFDTDGTVWVPSEYLTERRATFGTLLQLVEGR